MKRGFVIAYLLLITLFCSLPYLVGIFLPTLSHPQAQYLALALLLTSFVAFAAARAKRTNQNKAVYAIGSTAIFFSSVSWWGIPFIDALFMLTALMSAPGFRRLVRVHGQAIGKICIFVG